MSVGELEALNAPHEITYTYTRSTGPMVGAFLGGLRDQKIFGVRGADGRILVPPCDYDPVTSADLTELVEVAATGVVTTWSWNEVPTEGQPLDHPFGWALVRLDGADTAMLAAVDAGEQSTMRTGMRVQARWTDHPVGSIQDLVCFDPEVSS